MQIFRILLTAVIASSLSVPAPAQKVPAKAQEKVNITIGGELRTRLLKNFDRLEEEKYQPDHVFLTEQQSGWWPGDTEGRTILGLVCDAASTGRRPLYLAEILHRLPAHLNSRGYLGTIHPSQADEQQLSGHGWMLRGLSEYYLDFHDASVLPFIKSIVDSLFVPIEPYVNEYPLDPDSRRKDEGRESGNISAVIGHWRLSTDIGCIFIAMDGYLQGLQVLKDAGMCSQPQLCDSLASRLISLFLRFPVTEIKAQTHATLTGMRALIRYASMTGNPYYIVRAARLWQTYRDYGMTEDYANYNWFRRYDTWTEPCAVVDSYMVASQLWRLTRRPEYLADAERIYWNAIASGQRNNGGFGTDNCPGLGSKTNDLRMACYEAHWCCTMRGGEGLHSAADYSAMASGDTLFIVSLRPLEASAVMNGGTMKVSVATSYPFAPGATITVATAPAGRAVLALPVLPWMKDFAVTLNGRKAKGKLKNGMMTIARRYKAGDVLTVSFDMKPEYINAQNAENAPAGAFRVAAGPLLLAGEAGNEGNLRRGEALTPVEGRAQTFRGQQSGTVISPLYHLMAPEACSANYSRRILFTGGD